MTSKSKQFKILEYEFLMNSLLLNVKSCYSPTFKSQFIWAEQDRRWSTYKGQQMELPKHRKIIIILIIIVIKSLLQDKKTPKKAQTNTPQPKSGNGFYTFSTVICCTTPPNT